MWTRKKKRQKKELKPHEEMPRNTRDTLLKLWKRLQPQKSKLIWIACMVVCSSAAYAIIPWTVGFAIDRLMLVFRQMNSMGNGIEMVKDALILPVSILIVATILNSSLSYVQQYMIASVGESLTLSLRKEMSEKINRLPLKYFDSHKTGELMSRFTTDMEKVSNVMQVACIQLISSLITIVLSMIVMVRLSPVLSILFFLFIGISVFATKFISDLSQRYYGYNLAAIGDLSGKIEEMYSGNRIIKIFNQQDHVIEQVEALNQKQKKANRVSQFIDYAIYPFIRLINQLGFVATALLGGFMVLKGQLSLGTVQALLQYVNQISEPITMASYDIMGLQAALAGAERVFEVLDAEEETAEFESQECSIKASAIHQGKVEFHHVSFGYTEDRKIIKDISLEVKPNETVAIVGPTGGGKTTLIQLILRFYELNGGYITVDGVDISQIPRRDLRRNIGMVLQDTWLFEGTIAENIAYGKRAATREEIVAAAKAACCDHFIRTLEHGYDTVISSESATISQGQMQLLTIARAMLTSPTIMILDEATSSVDTRTEVEIQLAFTRLMKDKTSFVIAHRLSTIKNADLIIVVKDGDIIEQGNHETLLNQHGFYASLYQSQFR